MPPFTLIYQRQSHFLIFICLVLYPYPAFALVEDYTPVPIDYIFYTIAITVLVLSAAIITAYKQYEWYFYVAFSGLLVLDAAAVDGLVAYVLGANEFYVWVVPFLIHSGLTSFGFLVVAWRLDARHPLVRLKSAFLGLAIVTLFFPLSSFFWLTHISLATMWMPVNVLFFLMILSQILPPLTWESTDRFQSLLIKAFPIVLGTFLPGAYLLGYFFLDFTQTEENVVNRIALLLFMGFSLAIVLGQAFVSAREQELAIRESIEAARREAEMKLALVNAETEYQNALSTVAQAKSRLAGVSHDLKQPISALRFAITHSREGISHDYEEKLVEAVNYIDSLAHAFLGDDGMSLQQDADSMLETADKLPVGTEMFAAMLRQMFEQEAIGKGIELRVRDCSKNLDGDPLSLMRIMSNLLGNAISHSGANRILVGFRSAGNEILFQVYDNGRGMTETELAAASVRGEKGSMSEGHGLGLNIVTEICHTEAMDFNLRSIEGKGTCATVRL